MTYEPEHAVTIEYACRSVHPALDITSIRAWKERKLHSLAYLRKVSVPFLDHVVIRGEVTIYEADYRVVNPESNGDRSFVAHCTEQADTDR